MLRQKRLLPEQWESRGTIKCPCGTPTHIVTGILLLGMPMGSHSFRGALLSPELYFEM